MAEVRRINRVHRSLSRPLTILGAERKLFFFAMCLGAATFNLLNSLLGGLMIFLLLYFLARWATETDPQILRFLLTAARLRAQYDPMKFSSIAVRRERHAQALPTFERISQVRSKSSFLGSTSATPRRRCCKKPAASSSKSATSSPQECSTNRKAFAF